METDLHPRIEADPAYAQYRLQVVSTLSWDNRRPAVARWLRPAALVAIVFTLNLRSRSAPRPGLHGEHLLILLALVGAGAGTVALLLGRSRQPPRTALWLPVYLVVIAASATLVWYEPNGSAFLGGFVAASMAASQLPRRIAIAVAGVCILALGAAALFGASRSSASILVNEIGAVAFFSLGTYARRLRERTVQAERLLAELAETREAQTRAAALAERQRLAREMHDVLAHSLSGLLLQLEGARLMATQDAGNPELPRTIERAHRLAKTGLEEARRAIGTLRDDDLPGPERLAALAEESGIACQVRIRGTARPLETQRRLTLYRVAQEALTNIHKHSNAERAEITLDYDPHGIRLRIEDFGVDPQRTVHSGGYGLTGMRERAELLGGTLTAAPTGTGFAVELWIPE